jgi:hypothetical protein
LRWFAEEDEAADRRMAAATIVYEAAADMSDRKLGVRG